MENVCYHLGVYRILIGGAEAVIGMFGGGDRLAAHVSARCATPTPHLTLPEWSWGAVSSHWKNNKERYHVRHTQTEDFAYIRTHLE